MAPADRRTEDAAPHERRMRAEASRASYIPPGSDHVVQADDDAFVQLLWLAWGPGA